jgi:hypothetical protein
MRARRRWPLLLLAAAGCGTDGTQPTARFVLPGATPGAGDDFYSLPFPNDLRRAGGHLDLAMFPVGSLIVEQYRVAATALDGFGLNAAIYARFDEDVDPASLPADAAATVADGASVYLVNVDPASPEHGQKTPIVVHFRATKGGTIGPDSLAVRPYPGFPLREGTTYALVLTRRLMALHAAFGPSATFAKMRDGGGDAAVDAARTTYAPLWAYLDEAGGDERADVISAAVFTTQHATQIVPALRAAVFALPAPTATSVTQIVSPAPFRVYTGAYQAPNFQTGDAPYSSTGGDIVVGADGKAVIQRTEDLRFAMTVPPGPMPAAGWPLAIYHHGTGGDYRSFIDDGTGSRLAAQGVAMISTDQVLHGPRNPGGSPEIAFYNFGNPDAARNNAVQGYADGFSLMRLGLGLGFTDLGAPIKIDPTRLYFFGHSQGGQTGPGFVAFEPSLSGAVMSGTGGLLYLALLYKTKPFDIPSLVSTFLRDEPVDEDNPSLALLQMWMERADGVNYAPLMVRHPVNDPSGQPVKPRNIFQTEGFVDTYSPNPGIEAFATALGGDLVMLPDTKAIEGLTLRGRAIKAAPFAGNLGGATAALGQYKMSAGSDGHFVVFDVAAAEKQAAQFLGTLAATGTATVVAP